MKKKAIYDLKVDQRKNKFEAKNKLIKIDIIKCHHIFKII